MEKVKTIYDFKIEDAMEHPKGISQTIPNEATSLKDLVYRAGIMAKLPEIYQHAETGPDEDFDDAYEIDDPMIDYMDNLSFIERNVQKIKEYEAVKAKKKANKAETSKSEENIQSEVENV